MTMKMYSGKNHKVTFNNGVFSVVENQTELVITQSTDYVAAKKVAQELDNGRGFNGWTPTFFTRDVKPVLEKVMRMGYGEEASA